MQNLMKGEPLKLVEGGKSQRTFIYIKDAIDVVQRMIVSALFPSADWMTWKWTLRGRRGWFGLVFGGT